MSIWAALHFAISTANPVLEPREVKDFSRWTVRSADAYHLPRLLLASLVEDESEWHPYVKHGSFIGLGEVGLLHYTNKRAAKKLLHDPEHNLHESARWLAEWRRICGDDPEKYIGAYQGAGCAPSPATAKILARWADLEIAAGWRRIEERELKPALVAKAHGILESDKPLGAVVRFSIEGVQYAGLIEHHGPKRGVSILREEQEHEADIHDKRRAHGRRSSEGGARRGVQEGAR